MPQRVVVENFRLDPVNRDDPDSLRHAVANRLLYSIGKDPATATQADWYAALAQVARDRMVERWMETTRKQYEQKSKRVYYLSMEFLVGRALTNALMSTGLYDELAQTLLESGLDIDETREQEPDPGPRQRWSWPACRLFPGFDGDRRPAQLRLRHPLRLRHVRPAYPQRLSGRATRRLAQERQSVGVSPPPGDLSDPLRRRGAARRRRRRALGRHRAGAGHGLRHDRAGVWHQGRQHPAPVARQGLAEPGPGDVQSGRLHAGGGQQEPVGERHAGSLSGRFQSSGARTAPAPGVLLRQRIVAGPASALHAQPRALQRVVPAGGDPPERHPSGHRRTGTDATSGGCSSHPVERCLGAMHAGLLLYEPHLDA